MLAMFGEAFGVAAGKNWVVNNWRKAAFDWPQPAPTRRQGASIVSFCEAGIAHQGVAREGVAQHQVAGGFGMAGRIT